VPGRCAIICGATTGPKLGHDIEQNIPIPAVRYGVIDSFGAVWRFQLEEQVKSPNTIPGDQIIEYPPVSDDSRYTFSLFAIPPKKIFQG